MTSKETRIHRLSIRNYKGIDTLTIDFPTRVMEGDPDIAAIGSKNGVGKTSILECCALAMTAANGQLEKHSYEQLCVDMIRSGEKYAEITADITLRGKRGEVRVAIEKNNDINYKPIIQVEGDKYFDVDQISSILGFSPEPYSSKGVFYIHGYRKVKEGSLDIGTVLKNDLKDTSDLATRRRIIRRRTDNFSLFKQIVMRLQLNEADLLEKAFKIADGNESLDILKTLLEKYAGVHLNKFRPYEDSTLTILVQSVRDSRMIFPIDGLSSGQKEMISSLFTVWEMTRNSPSLVLIDEPELHVNLEWHREYIRELLSIAPNNQYIIATHSELVMDAIDEKNRFFISSK